MTVKEFFKSTAFKCIAVLLSILLVCGILLTICNSLFYVSAEEKFDRAVQKIYGKSVATEKIELTDDMTVSFSASSVSEVYLVEDGNYLIKSTGKQGFGGDVTCWVVVRMSGDGKSVLGAGNIAVDKASGESYLSKIDSSELAQFSKIEYEDGFVYELGVGGKDYIKTGASYTMRAISNAVNGAIEFVNVSILGGASETSPYEDFLYTDYIEINNNKTTHEVTDTEIKFTITTKANEQAPAANVTVSVDKTTGKITRFSATCNNTYGTAYPHFNAVMVGKGKDDLLALLGTDGSYDKNMIDSTLVTTATQTNFLVVYAGLFATANYQNPLFTTGGDAQ